MENAAAATRMRCDVERSRWASIITALSFRAPRGSPMRLDFYVSLLTKLRAQGGRQTQTFSTPPACQSCHFRNGVGSLIAAKDERHVVEFLHRKVLSVLMQLRNIHAHTLDGER